MVKSERALDLLKQAGMSGYEAKAYLALLGAGEPVNGYEVAKLSGVPRSTVYETLAKLVARGAAFQVAEDESTSYVPLPSEALVGRIQRDTQETIEGLAAVLPTIGKALDARVVQHLHTAEQAAERAIDVIESAKQTVWLSVWPEEIEPYLRSAHNAADRGVNVFTVCYGDVSDMPGRLYQHRFSSPDVVQDRVGCRLSLVVADHSQVVITGNTPDVVWGIWSDDPVVALVAAEHVRHDIALQLVASRLEEEGLGDFWLDNPDLDALRDSSTTINMPFRDAG
jgi:sugar-specific transcriptional regulator TrmB